MRALLRLAVAAVLVISAGCAREDEPPGCTSRSVDVAALDEPPATPSWAPRPQVVDGLTTLARATADGFALSTVHGPAGFLPGVNIGSSVPGRQPGELALTAEDYRAWFPAIGKLGIRAIRIYTIHPPEFYRELVRYNTDHPEAPLYLLQGVYFPDESYVEKEDLYDERATEAFSAELVDAVGAVYGDLARQGVAGRANGRWDTDTSRWLAGWVVGVELDPYAIDATDRRARAAPRHEGRYIAATQDATPTERWLAARMDELATAEAARGHSTPIAFVNWPTTDPLRHPEEPLEQEDLANVDANHVRATAAWPASTFASYHAYPYYPDFQRHEPALQQYIYNGRRDPYAGYLDALKRHHTGMPVMITEFGVPSALGSAHNGPLGRDQGEHDERSAMRMDAELLRLMKDTGLAGGFVFAWTDEWFKFTWNTIAHQVPPGRRQLWHDPLTNEQYFGIVATDPTGGANPYPQSLSGGDVEGTARIDESYLHLELRIGAPPSGPVTVGLDVAPQPPGADAKLVLDPAARAGQAWIRVELDPLPLDHPAVAEARPDPIGGWQRYQLVTNRPLTVPSTGRQLPMELQDVGRMRWGNWDPAAPDHDSLALWHLDDDVLSVRIPWAIAGFADPSSHNVLVPAAPQHITRSPGIAVSLTVADQTTPLGTVTWDDWQCVGYRERLKPGADELRSAMLATSGQPG